MKINDSNLLGAAQSSAAQAQELNAPSTGRGSSRPGSSGVTGGDSFQISSLGSSLRSLAAQSPDRSGQVASLASVFKSGRYQVNAADVSQSLVSDSIRA